MDGEKVAERKFERTIPFRISADETLDIGEDTGTPVSEDYKVLFKFNWELFSVAIKLGDEQLNEEDQKIIHDIRAKIGPSR